MYHLMVARVTAGTPNKQLGELTGEQFDALMAERVKKGFKVHTVQIISVDGGAVNIFILWEMAKS